VVNRFGITKDAILECINHKIDFVSLSKRGSPLFTFLPLKAEDKFLPLMLKRLNINDRQRIKLSRLFVENSIKGKLSFLRYKRTSLLRSDKEKAEKLGVNINHLISLWKRVKKVKRGEWKRRKERLLSLEGEAARVYFNKAFPLIFKKKVYKGTRNQDGGDLVNMCLNYGYGILKYFVFNKLIDKKINPFNNVYHYQEDKTKFFLVFDLMEGLRHTVVDGVVHGLVCKNLIKNNDIEKEGHLKIEKRILIIEAVNKTLRKREKHLDKCVKLVAKYQKDR